jgi:hypothetical protein
VSDLDRLLDEWGRRSRLTPAEAEEVLLAVVATRPAGLDAAWWSGLAGQVSTAVIQATALPASARAALSRGWPLPAPSLA